MSGVLYGIGVGPGDPELMTLKAIRVIQESDVIILPTEPKEDCYAYQTIKKVIPQIDEKEIICKHFPMIMDPAKLHDAHDRIYREIASYLVADKKVAFLTIGDPSLYSTYGYVQSRAVSQGMQTQVIPGVTSICAVAAQLNIPLGEGSEQIHIIPGSAKLEDSLKLSGTRIYMKSGKKLAELKAQLEKQKEDCEVWAVSNCGLRGEQLMHGISQLDADSGYLTVVVVKEKKVL